MPLDATVGGANSNSYVTNAEADAFFANRLEFATWDAELDQDLALMTATSELEQYEAYGYRATETQALQWPRYGVEKPDSVGDYPTYYSATEIPKPLKDLTCLRALNLLSPTTGTSSGSGSSQTLKIGKSVTFETKSETSSSSSSSSSGGILAEAGRLMRGLLKGAAGVPMVRA